MKAVGLQARLLAIAIIAASGAAASCSGPSKGELERKVTILDAGGGQRASPGSFRANGVNLVFEKRCGSLDCHGDVARNLRIYSSRGLRLPNDAGLVPGSGDTTLDEITANYQSIMTLEPEATNAVIEGGDPYQLLIVKKPLEIERHKSGPIIRQGDDAERCIVSWLKEDTTAPIDKGACDRAAVFPKE